jgi:hypothetical protein
MSVLYLHFENDDRPNRLAKLQKSGAHVVVAEPRWPGFFELAKREKPYAIALDFSQAPSHSLETADYLSKAKETRDAALFLLRVPNDRKEAVIKRLPAATLLTENELSGRLAQMEREAAERARQKKEAAAAAKKAARAAGAAAKAAAAGKPLKPAPPAPKSKPAATKAAKAAPSAPKKKAAKKPAPAKKPQPRKKK